MQHTTEKNTNDMVDIITLANSDVINQASFVYVMCALLHLPSSNNMLTLR